MEKYVKIVFEDWTKSQTQSPQGVQTSFAPIIKEALVKFTDQNSVYVENTTYQENFDMFLQDVADCGYIYLNPNRAISTSQVKYFEAHNPTCPTENRADNNKPNRKRPRRRTGNRAPKQSQSQNNQPSIEKKSESQKKENNNEG
ncbi:MAG: hypothetical protein WC119_02865 [Synergistaceae bacterium]